MDPAEPAHPVWDTEGGEENVVNIVVIKQGDTSCHSEDLESSDNNVEILPFTASRNQTTGGPGYSGVSTKPSNERVNKGKIFLQNKTLRQPLFKSQSFTVVPVANRPIHNDTLNTWNFDSSGNLIQSRCSNYAPIRHTSQTKECSKNCLNVARKITRHKSADLPVSRKQCSTDCLVLVQECSSETVVPGTPTLNTVVARLGCLPKQHHNITPDSGFCTPCSDASSEIVAQPSPQTFNISSTQHAIGQENANEISMHTSGGWNQPNVSASPQSDHGFSDKNPSYTPLELSDSWQNVKHKNEKVVIQDDESPLALDLSLGPTWRDALSECSTTKPSINSFDDAANQSDLNSNADVGTSGTQPVPIASTLPPLPVIMAPLIPSFDISGSNQLPDNVSLVPTQKRKVLKELQLNRSLGPKSTFESPKSRYERPGFSYMDLIKFALKHSNDGQLTLKEILSWIEEHFPYFRYDAKKSWKNSIRHNLSLHPDFCKADEKKHGGKWKMAPGHGDGLQRLLKPVKLVTPPKPQTVFSKRLKRLGPQPILPKATPYALVPIPLASFAHGNRPLIQPQIMQQRQQLHQQPRCILPTDVMPQQPQMHYQPQLVEVQHQNVPPKTTFRVVRTSSSPSSTKQQCDYVETDSKSALTSQHGLASKPKQQAMVKQRNNRNGSGKTKEKQTIKEKKIVFILKQNQQLQRGIESKNIRNPSVCSGQMSHRAEIEYVVAGNQGSGLTSDKGTPAPKDKQTEGTRTSGDKLTRSNLSLRELHFSQKSRRRRQPVRNLTRIMQGVEEDTAAAETIGRLLEEEQGHLSSQATTFDASHNPDQKVDLEPSLIKQAWDQSDNLFSLKKEESEEANDQNNVKVDHSSAVPITDGVLVTQGMSLPSKSSDQHNIQVLNNSELHSTSLETFCTSNEPQPSSMSQTFTVSLSSLVTSTSTAHHDSKLNAGILSGGSNISVTSGSSDSCLASTSFPHPPRFYRTKSRRKQTHIPLTTEMFPIITTENPKNDLSMQSSSVGEQRQYEVNTSTVPCASQQEKDSKRSLILEPKGNAVEKKENVSVDVKDPMKSTFTDGPPMLGFNSSFIKYSPPSSGLSLLLDLPLLSSASLTTQNHTGLATSSSPRTPPSSHYLNSSLGVHKHSSPILRSTNFTSPSQPSTMLKTASLPSPIAGNCSVYRFRSPPQHTYPEYPHCPCPLSPTGTEHYDTIHPHHSFAFLDPEKSSSLRLSSHAISSPPDQRDGQSSMLVCSLDNSFHLSPSTVQQTHLREHRLICTPPVGGQTVTSASTSNPNQAPSEMLQFHPGTSGIFDSSLFDNIDTIMQSSFESKTP